MKGGSWSLSYVILSKWNIGKGVAFGVATLMNLPTSELGFNVFYAPHSSKEKWSDENTCHPIKEHTKFTPLKINMELKDHPNDKEHHLLNLIFGFKMLIFQGGSPGSQEFGSLSALG